MPETLIRRSVRAMTGYTPGEQPTDPQIIKLNTNENPYPPSPAVAEALKRFDPARLRLYPPPLSEGLRGRAAALHGCGVEHVFAGNGSDEILALCTRAFVEADGTIGYFEPSYSLYSVLAGIADVRTAPVELGPDFEWRMRDGYSASLFFLTCPNAPTGIRYPKETIRAFCRTFPGVVVIDEAYGDFARENCMDLALSMENVLVMRTFSKSYSLAGLRVGYAVGAPDLIGALYKIKDSYNLDALAQTLATAALEDVAYMRATAARICATRDRLAAALTGLGFRVYPSETNFLWVRPGRGTAREVFEALRARKIIVRYFPGARTGDYIRITVGTDAEIEVLIKAVREMGVCDLWGGRSGYDEEHQANRGG
jgi:histidinol-phosphate aminotransferase